LRGTLEEEARVYGVTRERVRQLERRGLDRLREPGRRDRLADFAGAEDFRVTRARGPGTPTVPG
jgi:RNA polymerase primary sigma factor